MTIILQPFLMRTNTLPLCTYVPSVTLHPVGVLAGSSTLPRMQGVSSGRSTPAGGPPVSSSACEPHRPANISSQYKTMRGRCHPALLERPASAQPGQQASSSCSASFDSKAGSARSKMNGQLVGSAARGRGRGRGSRSDFSSVSTKSVDFSEMDTIREGELGRQMKSKSSDDVMERPPVEMAPLRRTVSGRHAPPPAQESPVTSPDIPRRHGPQPGPAGLGPARQDGYMSEPETTRRRRPRFLDIQEDSPASDQCRFDNNCYATTPSSSRLPSGSLFCMTGMAE